MAQRMRHALEGSGYGLRSGCQGNRILIRNGTIAQVHSGFLSKKTLETPFGRRELVRFDT